MLNHLLLIFIAGEKNKISEKKLSNTDLDH